MPSLIIVRHGSTDFNRGGVGKDQIRGQLDLPLTDEGRAESQTAAAGLRDCKVHTILAADLKRTSETGHIISQATGGAPVLTTPHLRAWGLGALEGQPATGATIERIKYLVRHPDVEPPHGQKAIGETFNSFQKRIITVVDNTMKAAAQTLGPDDCVVLVTSARPIQLIQLWFQAGQNHHVMATQFAEELTKEPDTVAPGGFIRIDYDGKAWRLAEKEKPAAGYSKLQ